MLAAPKLIAAIGTHERVVPFPGWTTPGVIGLAATTILLKSQRMLPGRATLLAGCGPLLLAVAAGILKGGGSVVAVVDVAGPGEWLARLLEVVNLPENAWAGDRCAGSGRKGVCIRARKLSRVGGVGGR